MHQAESRPRFTDPEVEDFRERLRRTQGQLWAARERIAVLEEELLDALGRCRNQKDFDYGCRLHFAHAGPCDVVHG